MVNDLTWVPKSDHIIHHITSLHWLPIDTQTQYKLAPLYYSCLKSTAPGYLSELLQVYKPACQLHSSSDTSILWLPSVCTHLLGQRSISYAAPSVWNSLPCKVRSSNTLMSFIIYYLSFWLCACTHACVCVRACMHAQVCFCSLLCNGLCAPIWGNGT